MPAMFRITCFPAWLSTIGLCLLAGCGKVNDGYTGPRGEVEGTITYNGEPIPEGSSVMFQSAEGKTYVGVALVTEDGKYQLKYSGTRLLPAIAYKVQITPPPIEDDGAPDPATADPSELTPEAMAARAKEHADANPPPFPARYGNVQTSGLTFTVEEGANTADFELKE